MTTETPPPAPKATPFIGRRWRRRPLTPEEIVDRKLRRWAELLETIILTLATFATAWAGYQASQWNNAQAALNVQTTTLLLDASQQNSLAQQQELLDMTLFTRWVDAFAAGNTRLAAFYRDRFRDEFRPAFDLWLAGRPLDNPDAPGSPFETEAYQLAARVNALALQEEAENTAITGEIVGSFGDRYTLITVILAGSLLLAGLSNRFEWEELRAFMAGLALLVLVGSVVAMFILPNA